MAEVRFSLEGFAFIRLFIRPNAMLHMPGFNYKVDSGANRTTISRDILHSLGYDDTWIQSFKKLTGSERPTVATGVPIDNCYIISLPEIQLGGCVGFNWPFLVSLDDNIQYRLLFGADSMQFFNWTFNYETGKCLYEIIPSKRRLLFNGIEQSIHDIT